MSVATGNVSPVKYLLKMPKTFERRVPQRPDASQNDLYNRLLEFRFFSCNFKMMIIIGDVDG